MQVWPHSLNATITCNTESLSQKTAFKIGYAVFLGQMMKLVAIEYGIKLTYEPVIHIVNIKHCEMILLNRKIRHETPCNTVHPTIQQGKFHLSSTITTNVSLFVYAIYSSSDAH